ncbi:hypothetical protein C8Q74DRAFT_566294 [Fomes fomentarius]|nr:hypothetical protein C8Q74DRAFT_566294 [Fomes fomentarius]
MSEAPFDAPAADVILLSSDRVHFRVFRFILVNASPVFAAMFTSPQSHHTAAGVVAEPDLIEVEEPSDVLETLLRLIHPFPEQPSFVSFDEAKPLFIAAHKYGCTRVLPMLTRAAMCHIKAHPLRAYALAVRYHLDDLARTAARQYICVVDTVEEGEEMEDISAREFQRLLAYRRDCARALASLDQTWKPKPRVKNYDNRWMASWGVATSVTHRFIDIGSRRLPSCMRHRGRMR